MNGFVNELYGTPVFSFFLALVFLMLLLAVSVLVLWVAMPFSVFGVKGLMKKMIAEQKDTNRLLNALLEKYGREEEKGG